MRVLSDVVNRFHAVVTQITFQSRTIFKNIIESLFAVDFAFDAVLLATFDVQSLFEPRW